MRKLYLLLTALFSFSAFISKSQTCSANFEFRDSVRTNSMSRYVRLWPIPKHLENKAVTSICWDFGDGKDTCINATSATPINTSSILHHYQQNGNYNVCLKIKYAGGCEAHYCKTISLQTIADNSCKANFEIGQTDNAQRKLFVAQPWHSTGRKPEKICWDFGDGKDTCIVYNAGTSNNYAVYHKYEKAGTYKVCAKIIYSGGCVSTTCKELKIEAVEECGADFKLETLSASGTTKQFIALPATNHQRKPVKICWQFGDGKDTCIQYPSTYTGHYTVNHTYARGGEYKACIKIVYAGGCEAHYCKTISLQTIADNSCKANFEIGQTDNAQRKLFVAQPWHSTGRKPEKICWDFGDGKDTCIVYNAGTSNNYAVYHKYEQAGTYKVCAKIIYSGGCVSTTCKELKIEAVEECGADFKLETLSASGTTKQFIALPATNHQRKPVKICWQFGDGKDTCIQYPSTYTGHYTVNHTYARGGAYEACIKIIYAGGCEARKCKKVEVSTPATINCTVQIKEIATISEGLYRYLSAIPMTGLRPEKVCWTFGDGKDTCINLSATTNLQHLNIGHKYPAPGVYKTCVKIFYAGGCIAYQCHELVIRGQNNVCGGYFTESAVSPNTIIFNGFSLNAPSDPALSYRWVFGDGTTGTGPQVKHEYANVGIYQVCLFLKTTSGCETKICKNITLPGRSNVSQIQLHPNPVIHHVRVQFHSLHKEAVLVSILNSSGIVVRNYTRTAVLGNNIWEFDLSGLSSGFYSVLVRSPRQVASAGFFKQ